MILAAGVGSRLGALTANTPKALIDINGRPMLRWVSEQLSAAGVTEIIINLHHHSDLLRDYAQSALSDLFKTIAFSAESSLLGTGGGLKAAASFFSNVDSFFLVNADIYCAYPLQNLMEALHKQSSSLGQLAVMDRQESTYLTFDQNNVFRGWVKEGSASPEGLSRRAFCGIQALTSKIFAYLQKDARDSFSIIETYQQAEAAGEQLIAHDIGNYMWIDMGTPERLQQLRATVKSNC